MSQARNQAIRQTFDSPADDRWFEDYQPGRLYRFGRIEVNRDEVVCFASQFDPQPFHIDEKAAAESPFGGLIASGWHTASMVMRVLVDHYVSAVASLSSPGVDELRWLAPVRPGDILSVGVEIQEARRSQSRPDRGIVIARVTAFDQNDRPVMSLLATNFYSVRPALPASGAA